MNFSTSCYRTIARLSAVGAFSVVLGAPVLCTTADAATTSSLAPSGKEFTVRIGSNTSPGCSWGDLDLMNMELDASTKKSMIASIEPLSGEGAAQTKAIENFDLTKGFVAKFEIPQSKPSVYALYICKDSSGTGKCTGKELMKPNKLIQSYSTTVGEKGKVLSEMKAKPPVPNDKIYYFGFLFVDGKGNLHVMKTEMQDADYKTLSSMLEKNGVKNADATVGIVKARHLTIGSYQPTVGEDRLSVNLPRLNKEACQSK